MNYAAIYHRSNNQYCYMCDSNTLEITLKTGKEINSVTLVNGDPFMGETINNKWEWDNSGTIEMNVKCELQHHLIWSIKIKPPFKRVKYYFKITSNDITTNYLEEGFYTDQQVKEIPLIRMFNMPWMNESDIIKVPTWVKDTIWYQIFPERFCNGDSSLNEPWFTKWKNEGTVTNKEFYGGDLQGIINKLEYLHNLGITGIYLTPIFKSPSSHKYDTTDYFEIDPFFGNEKKFKELVSKAKELNIKIMIDLVFNHSGEHFMQWQDVLKNKEKSEYKDWFFIHDFENLEQKESARAGNFYSFAFCDHMPKLNTNNIEVQNFLLDAVKYYVETLKVDALRLDVANEVSHAFWRRMRTLIDSINPEIYILGEVWNDSIKWLEGDQFHSVMNYPFTTAVGKFFGDKSRTTEQLKYDLNDCYSMYSEQVNQVLFNLLDSHDTDRLRSRLNSIDEYYLHLLMLFTFKGTPSIYYGTEIALEGGSDPDCRRCMPWESIEKGVNKDVFEMVQNFIKLRKELKFNNFSWDNMDTRIIKYNVDDYTVIINSSEDKIEIECNNLVISNNYDSKTLLKNGFIVYKNCNELI